MFLLWQQKSQAYFYPSGSVCLWHQTAKTIDIRKDNTGISDNTFTSPSGERLEIKVRKVLSHHTVTVWNICSSHIILTQVFFFWHFFPPFLLRTLTRQSCCSEQLALQDSVQTFNAYRYSKHFIYLYMCYIYISLLNATFRKLWQYCVTRARTHTHAHFVLQTK